jgi:hypothetical protein
LLRKLLFFILLISILGACNQKETRQDSNVSNNDTKSAISLEEIKAAIQEQGLELKVTDLQENNVFIQELIGVSPKAYTLEGKMLSTYVFHSLDDREGGMKAFEEATATAKLEPYKTFNVHNVLVFYIEGNEEINNKLVTAIDGLN